MEKLASSKHASLLFSKHLIITTKHYSCNVLKCVFTHIPRLFSISPLLLNSDTSSVYSVALCMRNQFELCIFGFCGTPKQDRDTGRDTPVMYRDWKTNGLAANDLNSSSSFKFWHFRHQIVNLLKPQFPLQYNGD